MAQNPNPAKPQKKGREYRVHIWENPVDQTYSYMVMVINGRAVNIASGSKVKNLIAAGWRAISAIYQHYRLSKIPPIPPRNQGGN